MTAQFLILYHQQYDNSLQEDFTFICMTLTIKTCTEFNIATWLKIVEFTKLNIWERNFETNEIHVFLSVS